jgi:hypothetical protein
MAELYAVHQRLEAALGRLDSAVAARLDRAAPGQQVDDLSQELERANAENAALQETTTKVARRLDATIERIRKILGE